MTTSNQTNQSKTKALFKTLVPWVFYGLVAIFLIVYIMRTDFSQFDKLQVSIPYIVISTVLALTFRYWGAFIWFVLLKGLGATNLNLHIPQLIYVYAKSWLGRYIPGTVPWILGKIYFASQHGISKNKLAVSSLLEGALQIVVTLALAFLLLVFDSRLDVISIELKWAMVAILVVCITAMIPAVFNKLISVAYKLIRKKTLDREHLAKPKTIISGALLYTIGILISGASFFFIAKSIYPALNYGDALFVIGASSLAAALSMLAVFVPSGLGIREGIQILLLSIIMPAEIAVIIAIVMRLWSIGVDFAFFGLSKLLTYKKLK